MPTALAATIGLATIAMTSMLGGLVAYWFDSLLELHAIAPGTGALPFAISIAAMATLVGAAAFRYTYVAAQWQQGVAAQARAQFDALQARIRPHFLFNSMNTIAGLIRSRPAEAEAAVEDLSDLFRAALRDDDRPSTLADEIDLLRRYLSIEGLRLGPRLQVRIDVDELPPIEMPALLLQPLVENAVLHGIQQIPQGGTVTIGIHRRPDSIDIEIHNPRPRAPAASRGSGTALDNVRRRLAFHYGQRAHMEVDQGEDYYRVSIRLPTS
jgi:two-component system sensor histidine kinase AlgZ